MDGTKPWASKTVWLNLIFGVVTAVSAFLPGLSVVTEWINANMGVIGSVWAVLGVIVRFVTKDAIVLKD